MKTTLILMCLLGFVYSVSFLSLFEQEWQNFKLEFGKKYRTAMEEEQRMNRYMHNVERIRHHNRMHELGTVSYKLRVNRFADMNLWEIKKLNGLKTWHSAVHRLVMPHKGVKGIAYIPVANVELPRSVDWRTLGAVTPVKDQKNCGSCWSFSATGALEGQHFRKTKKLISLSEQNLLDCSEDFGNHGCNGGDMDFAFNYIKKNGGIDTESSYPYLAVQSQCRYNASESGATDKGYFVIAEGSEDDLKTAVATVGPIAVGIDATNPSFHYYSEGVYDEPNCSSNNIDHGVLVVGYGTNDKGIDYWIVKNSWGENWGVNGYIYMSRNKDNQCGIASTASYPLV